MKIGIIGCGKQAEKHLKGFRSSGLTDFVVSDISAERASAFAEAHGTTFAASTQDLLADTTVHGVAICTPTPTHYPLIKSAIAQGKHYLVEKPLSDTLEQAQELADATRQAGLVGAVGFTYRFAPSLVAANDLLREAPDELGQIATATLRIGGRGSHEVWKHQKKTGGGAIQEMLVHMVDLAVWMFGEMDQIKLLDCQQFQPVRQIKGEAHNVDAEDYVVARLTSKSGTVVTLVGDFITPSFVQYSEIQGQNGTAMGSIQGHINAFVFKNTDGNRYSRGAHDLAVERTDIVADLDKNFVDAMRGECGPRCSVSDAVEVQRITEEILRQANSL